MTVVAANALSPKFDADAEVGLTWSPRQLGGIVGAYGLAALAVVVAWFGASAEVELVHQVPWLIVGAVGVMLAGVGTSAWLLAARRALGIRAAELAHSVAELPRSEETTVQVTASDEPTLVAARGMTKYHTTTCLFAAGKRVSTATRVQHEAAGRAPCGICQPTAADPT